jgi:hypothetical protein
MQYLRAYRFVFTGPHWQTNLLCGAVCQMVPVLGQIVFTGYALELLEAFREDDDAHLPAFDMDRIGAYVTRGMWPFLVQLGALLPVLLVLWLMGFLLGALASDLRSPAVLSRMLLAVLGPISFVLLIALSVLLAPVTLHVGLRQELHADIMPFVKDFLKRVGHETILAQLFLGATSLAMIIIGSMLFCIPAYAALGLAHFAQYHLLAQLYELYRQRGGAPVPSRSPATAV